VEVFRLAHKNFTSLDGKGGLYGVGRWHHIGFPVIYAGGSRSLAVLERFIHDKASLTIPNLKMLTIHIPDNIEFEQHFISTLPLGWDTTANEEQQATQDIGIGFLKANTSAFLKVPSAIVPHEYNYIINPLHPEATKIDVIDTHDYQYDERYKRIIRE
jgi:RES domain-containing protein|tara:strand:- start:1130 stop:1603 length:474 start_codon:yes stop_codon:yes gene_type:complete